MMKNRSSDRVTRLPFFDRLHGPGGQLPAIVTVLILLAFGRVGAQGGGLLRFDGMLHQGKGQASIALSGDSSLIISNIGDTGTDGADVLLGQSKGFGFSFHSPNPFTQPVGDYKQWTMLGNISGQDIVPLWTERHQVVNYQGSPAVQVSFDATPLGASLNFVRLYDANGMVALEKIVPAGPLYTRLATCCNPELTKTQWDATCVVIYVPPEIKKIAFPDGQTVETKISKIETGPMNPTYKPRFCTVVESRLKGGAVSEMKTESLPMFQGRYHHFAVGATHFETGKQGNLLTLKNLGNSGDDGVDIDLKNSTSYQLSLAPIFTTDDLSGLAFGAFGTLGAAQDVALGNVRHLAQGAGKYRVIPDFSDLNAQKIIFQVMKAGQLQYTVQTGGTGAVVTVGAWPSAIGKLEGIGGGLSCYAEQFPSLQNIVINGVSTPGDELRMLVDLPAPVSALSRFSLRSRHIPEVSIVAEFKPSSIDITLESPKDSVFYDPGDVVDYSWTTSGGYSGPYYLKILELNIGDPVPPVFPDSAACFFYRSGITETSFQYGSNLPPFTVGKKYAWVIGIGGGIIATPVCWFPTFKKPCKLVVNGIPTTPLCPGDCFTLTGPVVAYLPPGYAIITYSDQPTALTVNGAPPFPLPLLDNVALETPPHFVGSGGPYSLNVCVEKGSSTPIQLSLYFYRPPSSPSCTAAPMTAPCCYDQKDIFLNVVNVPRYDNLSLSITHPVSHSLLTSICSGDPINVCLRDALGNIPPPGSPVAPVITWECSTNGGAFMPVTYTNFSPTQFCFNVPGGVVEADCTFPSKGYEDKIFRAILTVTDPISGKICTYQSSDYALRICCPVPQPTVVLNVQPPGMLNGTLCEGDVVTIDVSLTGLPSWFPPAAGSVVTIDWFLNGVPITLPPGTTQFSYPVTVGTADLCFSVDIQNCSCPGVTAQACIPVDPAPKCGTIIGCHNNLTLVASSPMLCYEICPFKDASVCIDQPFTDCIVQWEFSFNQVTWTNLGSSNPIQNTNTLPCDDVGSPYEWPAGQQCIYYRVVGYPLSYPAPSGCEPCYSNIIKVCLKPAPVMPVITISDAEICKGSQATLTVTNPQTGINYTWYYNGVPITACANSTTCSVSDEGWYWVVADNGCEATESNHVFLNVCEVKALISCPLYPNACAKLGEEIHLSGCDSYSTCTGGTFSYTWSASSGAPGTTSSSFTNCDLYHFPDASGTTYTLTVTWTKGSLMCTDTTSVTIVPCQ